MLRGGEYRKMRAGTANVVAWALLLAGFLPDVRGGNGRKPADDELPPFCGPPDQRFQVIKQAETAGPAPLQAGKTRLYLFWRANRALRVPLRLRSCVFARSRFPYLLPLQPLDLPGSEHLRMTGLVHATAPFPV